MWDRCLVFITLIDSAIGLNLWLGWLFDEPRLCNYRAAIIFMISWVFVHFYVVLYAPSMGITIKPTICEYLLVALSLDYLAD